MPGPTWSSTCWQVLPVDCKRGILPPEHHGRGRQDHQPCKGRRHIPVHPCTEVRGRIPPGHEVPWDRRCQLLCPGHYPHPGDHRTGRRLIEKDVAYVTETGVYFNLDTFEHNGELSGQERALRVSRVTDATKHNPHDFALWKTRGGRRVHLGLSRGAGAGPVGISRTRQSPRSTSGSSTISTAGGLT